MALRGTLEHPKTLALADALGIMDCFALGILEAFWHHVGKYHEDGDVTDLRPSIFARSIRYAGDSSELWEALISCGFLDETGGKTIVHGWSEHADDAVHSRLYRSVKPFADGRKPKARGIGADEKTRLQRAWEVLEQLETSGQTVAVEPKTDSHQSPTSGPPLKNQSATVLPVPEPVPVSVPVPEPVPGVPVGDEPLSSEPIVLFDDPVPESPPNERQMDKNPDSPYGVAEAIMVRFAEQIGASPPTPAEIRAQIRPDTPVQKLFEKYRDVQKVIELAVYATKVRSGIDWRGIWQGCTAFEVQMRDGVKSVYDSTRSRTGLDQISDEVWGKADEAIFGDAR